MAAHKSASEPAPTLWDQLRTSPDPVEREFAWGQTFGPWIQKAQG
ncbi:hypothetical protein AB0O05_28785 [Streptomyces sp. NPDC093084]